MAGLTDLAQLVVMNGIRRASGSMSDYDNVKEISKYRNVSTWDALKGGILGAVDPSLSEKYWGSKLQDIEDWKQRQQMRGYQSDIDKAVGLQTQSAQEVINRQLDENLSDVDRQYAQYGSFRSGARDYREDRMRTEAQRAVTQVAAENALRGQAMKMGLVESQRDYDFKVAQMESAANAGNAEMASSIAENLVPSLVSKIFGNSDKGYGTSSEWSVGAINEPQRSVSSGETFGPPSPVRTTTTGRTFPYSQPNLSDLTNDDLLTRLDKARERMLPK